MFGHLPGTWANVIYKRLSFPVGWKQSTNTCHICATCEENPSLAPPFCMGGCGWLTLTSPSKRQTWTLTLSSHWGKPQNKESNFLFLYPPVLVHLGCCNQKQNNTSTKSQGWFTRSRNSLLTVLEPGGQRPECQYGQVRPSCRSDLRFLAASFHGERG